MSWAAGAARSFFFDDLRDLRALFVGQLQRLDDCWITKGKWSALLQGELIEPRLLLRFELGHDRVASTGELRLARRFACIDRLIEISIRFVASGIQGGKGGLDLGDLLVAQAEFLLHQFVAEQHQRRERLDQG